MNKQGDTRIPIPDDSRVLIFSDLHLPQKMTEESAARLERLFGMLESEAPSATHIVLLGDVFDFWFEYQHLVPTGHFGLLWKLRSLVNHGKKVIFFPGNHDYWIGNFFEQEMGFRVARETEYWVLGNRTLALTHGDGCDPSDKGYHLLKRILRSPLAIKAFSLVHPELAFAVARLVSALSRKASEKKKTWYNSRFVPFARKAFERGADALLVGHSHTPQMVDIGTGILVNTGDWLEHNTYCLVSTDTMEIRVWPTGKSLPVQGPEEFENPPLGTS